MGDGRWEIDSIWDFVERGFRVAGKIKERRSPNRRVHVGTMGSANAHPHGLSMSDGGSESASPRGRASGS